MSSTNRTNAQERHISDYYITPIDVIQYFIENFISIEGNIFDRVLDPCAGGDSLNPMSYPTALSNLGIKNVKTIDIREDSLADIKGNYLELEIPKGFNVIITNPPFNQAEEVIQKSLNDISDNGYVIMLLRLNFLGSQKRKPFWDKYPPKYIFIHSKRISFMKDIKGKAVTDSIEYAHFVWQKGNQEQTKLFVI